MLWGRIYPIFLRIYQKLYVFKGLAISVPTQTHINTDFKISVCSDSYWSLFFITSPSSSLWFPLLHSIMYFLNKEQKGGYYMGIFIHKYTWQTGETVCFAGKATLWCIVKRICVDFFKVITKLNVAAPTSTQISDHRILLQTNGWHEVEAK